MKQRQITLTSTIFDSWKFGHLFALSPLERWLLVICPLVAPDAEMIISTRALSEACGAPENDVRAALRELQCCGLLTFSKLRSTAVRISVNTSALSELGIEIV